MAANNPFKLHFVKFESTGFSIPTITKKRLKIAANNPFKLHFVKFESTGLTKLKASRKNSAKFASAKLRREKEYIFDLVLQVNCRRF